MGLWEQIKGLLVILALAMAWSGLGAKLLGRRQQPPDLLTQASYPVIGALSFALVALLLSVPGWCTPAVCGCLLAMCLPLVPRRWVKLPGPGWCLLALATLGALAPTTHVDTQIYHYPLPQRYLEHGGLHWTGIGAFDGVFHLFHLILIWPLALGGETAANMLGPACLLVLGLTLASFQPGRWLPWLLVASSPCLVVQSSGGLPELPAATLALLALAWWHRAMSDPSDRGAYGLASLFCAAAISMRLNLAPLALAMALASCLVDGRKARCLLVLALSGLFCLPWVGFNLWHTGHPLYPVGARWKFAELQAAASPPVAAPAPMTPAPFLAPQLPGLQGLPWSLGPVTPGSPLRSWQNTLTPALLGGVLLALGRNSAGLAAPALLYLLLLIPLRIQDVRYGLPGAIWLMPLALSGWSRPLPRGAGAMLTLSLGLGMLVGWSTLLPRLPCLLGSSQREAYLAERLEVYQAYQWLATTRYRRVLLTDTRGWHCPKPWCAFIQDDFSQAALPYPEHSLAGIRQALSLRNCDLVLLNRNRPEAQLAMATREAPDAWRQHHPEGKTRQFRLIALLHLLQRGKVVYSRRGVEAIECSQELWNSAGNALAP